MRNRRYLHIQAFLLLTAILLWGFWSPYQTSVEIGGEGLNDPSAKIKGIHYFARHDEVRELQSLVNYNVRHLTLVPYAYQGEYNDPNLRFSGRRRSGPDRDSVYMDLAHRAHEAGLDVIIKPHIWMGSESGKWRSDIEFTSQHAWHEWSQKYTSYILHYARLSEQMGASHFCIGTELGSLTRLYPEFWGQLIRQVRKVYSGKLFYAANWYQEFDRISFWSDLDYIGIQAYFPLSDKDQPGIETLTQAWRPHLKDIKRVSDQFDKPVLFSELGYKSTRDSASDPWEWLDHDVMDHSRICLETQANCYEAFFQTFWQKQWFAGVIVWQWRGSQHAGGPFNADFTPQQKPAQEIMADWFGRTF